ncbi:MAG TPA: FUSC family protein [Trebonia sp.]
MSAPGKKIGAALAGAAGWLARGRPIDGARVRRALWPITQTAVAAGLSYFIAHSLVGHVQPFFAPIAATVAMSTTTDLRAQRAVQLIAGVLLGIGIGTGGEALLGNDAWALAVTVFFALCVALAIGRGFIAEGALFFNQTAIAGILILTVHTNAEGIDRLVDALIGGGVALVFSLLLFPADPDTVLRRASQSVFAACERELRGLDEFLTRPPAGGQDWLLLAGRRIGQAVDGLERARATARETIRLAPGRRSARPAVARAERSAADFVALTSTVLTIGSLAVAAAEAGEPLPAELRESIAALRAALATAAAGSAASAATPDPGGSPSAAAATAATTASTSNAAVIASLAASCAALAGRAAGPGADPGAETGADAEPR